MAISEKMSTVNFLYQSFTRRSVSHSQWLQWVD